MVQCVLGVSHRALKQPEKYFCEPGSWALMLKAIFSTFGSWIIAASNLPEKILVHFLFMTTTTLVQLLNFIKETECLTFPSRK